jgi:hypothetical protein
MITISASDVIKKPSYITNPREITLVEDAKKHIKKSVVIPYALYELIREQIEDQIYLLENQKALSPEAYEDFLAIEESFTEDRG